MILTDSKTSWLVLAVLAAVSGGARGREAKALGYLMEDLEPSLYPEFLEPEDNEILSRTRPTNKPNSPIYYIRLPPSPYVLVPGVGYVSRPPSLRPPPMVQPRPDSELIRVPVSFVSNGKPTGVYTWKPPPAVPAQTPVTTLDKGPYFFNGRPTDIFLLRNTYNTLYDDGLQNFYP